MEVYPLSDRLGDLPVDGAIKAPDRAMGIVEDARLEAPFILGTDGVDHAGPVMAIRYVFQSADQLAAWRRAVRIVRRRKRGR